MTSKTTTATTYIIRRNSTGDSLGTIRLGRSGYRSYERMAQQPEGVITLGDLAIVAPTAADLIGTGDLTGDTVVSLE